MTSPMEGQTFLFMWIGFLMLMLCGIAAFFFWGIRTRQFGNQDRARYLPLMSGIPGIDDADEQARSEERRPSS